MVLKKDVLIQYKNDQGEVEQHYPITRAENIEGLEEKISEKVADDGYISIKEKGAAGGVASLGADGKVPAKQLPEMDYDAKGSAVAVEQKLDVHKGDKGNPHGVTKAQVGLGNVDNTSDANKPVSMAQKAAIDAVGEKADEAKLLAQSAEDKKYATYVIGHKDSGHTNKEVDYLCTGTDDQVIINQAIQALPKGGGKIIIRAGIYDITGEIVVDKNNVTLEGEGKSSILQRGWDSPHIQGIVRITKDSCNIQDLCFDGRKDIYPSTQNIGIHLAGSSSNNTISGNSCNNNTYIGIDLGVGNSNTVIGNTCNNNERGIYLSGNSNIITSNICNNNTNGGIFIILGSNVNNIITGNTCSNNTTSGIYVSGNSNAVTGNTCSNTTSGILLAGSSNTITGNMCSNANRGISIGGTSNTVIGNTCYRDSYSASQYSIWMLSYSSDNLVGLNNIIGKNVTNEGTNNTLVNNKYS